MTTAYVSVVIILYFAMLYVIARLSSRKANAATFFIANRNAPWPLVAYGMIGVSISGITFISVPGQVVDNQFSYFQMVMGYTGGLIVVAVVLLPVFYRIKAISIYAYLRERFGKEAHLTGTVFFLIAQTLTASFKLFLMAHVLQVVLFGPLGMPFWITVAVTLLLIWVYTYKGGIKTVIFTDILQTTFLLASVLVSVWAISQHLDLSVTELYSKIQERDMGKTFFWSWDSPHNFFKLFLTGLLMTVMTNGLDQSVMQKHLTCKNIRDAQKNLFVLAGIILIVNAFFLYLGGLLYYFGDSMGIDLPEKTDSIYPMLAIYHLGPVVGTLFILGIAAAAYSSADSSLTGLTTSFCVDILGFSEKDEHQVKKRNSIHFGFTLLIFLIILIFNKINNDSVLAAFIQTTGYVYGPLVGLFAFGLFTQKEVNGRWIPFLCIASPVLSKTLDYVLPKIFDGYQLGYAVMVVNSLITFFGLIVLSKTAKNKL
ncbi:sodium:solute symporter [Flexithrix dorotheae]|uniref:sodium:solute symporter n=1 Tax=Flexithrix dorotheae TaxID=70993 RepID=UPI0003611ED4|nr:sodium:solute symporter [Flexithrix dorotheae]